MKIKIWLNQLTNAKQLLLLFILYGLFLVSTEFLTHLVWPPDEPESLLRKTTFTVFEAVIFVVIFHFNKVKRLFKKKTA